MSDHDAAGAPDPVRLPDEIGGHRIQRVLGAGGMATVYAALQRQPRRTVAIKVLRGAAGSPAAVRRFRQEIEILGRLRHPYVAQVFGAGVYEEDGRTMPYYVMEYVPRARTILQYAEERDLDQCRRLRLFVKVCAAVDHGHRNKIIHRDLKPGNILIDENGEPKVIDFGVARAMELDASQTEHTEEGRFVGTIKYMAPEQLDPGRHDLDARCDVYALGVVLYRLLTGVGPYRLEGVPVFTAAQIIREGEPPAPSTANGDVPRDLDAIVMKALAKKPRDRYRAAGSLGRDILRFLSAQPVRARDGGGGGVHRLRLLARRRKVELAAVVVVLLVVLTASVVVGALLRGGDAGDGGTAAGLAAAVAPEDAGVGNGAAGPDGGPAPGPVPAVPAAPDMTPFVLAAGGAVRHVTFDDTARRLVAAVDGGELIVFDLDARAMRFDTADHDTVPAGVALVGDPALLISVESSGRVVLVDTERNKIAGTFGAPCGAVLAVAAAPGFAGGPSVGASVLAVSCPDLTVRLVDGAGTEQITLRGVRGAFDRLAFDAAGARLVGVSERGGVVVWMVSDGRRAAVLSVDALTPEPVRDTRPAGTGRSSREDDAATEPEETGERWPRVVTAGFREGGTEVVLVLGEGSIAVWAGDDVAEGDRTLERTGLQAGRIRAAVIDAAGRRVLALAGEVLLLHDLETGVTHRTTPTGVDARLIGPGAGAATTSIAISRDGMWRAVADEAGTIRVSPSGR